MIGNARDTSRDGWRNKLEYLLLARLEPFWRFVNAHPWLAKLFNGFIIDNAVKKAPFRPLALSTMASYTSWASLTDKKWFSRYLPPAEPTKLPADTDVATLFVVPAGRGGQESDRSTLLFPSFAQWFTDGFLVTDNTCRAQTHTNHQIDLSQLYGLTAAVTDVLRVPGEGAGRKGRLKSQVIDGGEFAEFFFNAGDEPSAGLPPPANLPTEWPKEKKATLFAFGGERANSTVFTAAINTLFLREHNRLCGILEKNNPKWNSDRVFEVARNINIVLLIKVVIEEYINHISPYWFKLRADPKICYKAAWNRENWIPVEFNLLYRWHSLVPEEARWNGTSIGVRTVALDNSLLLRDGLAEAFASASASAAWRIGLFNTSEMLQHVEAGSITQGRTNRLRSYNDYRELMGYPRVETFEQISGDPAVIAALKDVYVSVDRVEYFVGLFAEDLAPRSAVPPLIGRMVATDAFSHALTNPLLSLHVYNKDTFTQAGLDEIAATSTLRDLLARNATITDQTYISMDRRGCYASTADKQTMSYTSLLQEKHSTT